MEEDIYLDNKIYVLINSGCCDSDWTIEGFTYSEDEAIKICLQENEKDKLHYEYWYYLPISIVKRDGLEDIHPIYIYKVFAFKTKKESEWEFNSKENIEVQYSQYSTDIKKLSPKVEIEKSNNKYCYDSVARIYLCLDTLNRAKALKMAKDMLYEKIKENK